MKKIIAIILIIILNLIIPKYKELNNIKIIDGIGIKEKNNTYTIYFREIIPIKDNNSITYKYKYYKTNDKDITKAIKEANKKLYLNKIKFIVTNTNNYKTLNIKINKIYHTNNVYKKLTTIQKNK